MPMTTRNRRARALRLDMQLDSDVDMEPEVEVRPKRRDELNEDQDEGEGSNVDVETVAEGGGDDMEEDGEEEDDDDDGEGGEDDEEDEIESDADEPPKASGSRLKIRLKMPTQSSSRYETPLVESEDSMDSTPATTRPLTTRQAVLASVMDASHVSLGSSRQKKAPLNETELALRREETARKRRNLTEKKLEDEKAETINRLLKKQSRPRKKRNAPQRADMDDVAPLDTRSNSNSAYNPSRPKKSKKGAVDEDPDEGDGEDEDGMDEGEEAEEEVPEREVKPPTMYRWISTSRLCPGEGSGPPDAQMRITFSVPASALPPPPPPSNVQTLAAKPMTCPCGRPIIYRLVKEYPRGACGLVCLRNQAEQKAREERDKERAAEEERKRDDEIYYAEKQKYEEERAAEAEYERWRQSPEYKAQVLKERAEYERQCALEHKVPLPWKGI
ncbi:hypothetical protein DXG01_001276 [Tephrocybe rancida]|nr:hypothetical protein DXG01_001276 [Tephrocybe rancida]